MPENSNYEEPLLSSRTKEALREASAVLGRSAQYALFNDLEFNGIMFRDGQYTLMQLQDALRKIFGHEGTSLQMQRVERILGRDLP